MGSNTEFKITELPTDRSSSEDSTASPRLQPDRRKQNGSVGFDVCGVSSQPAFNPHGQRQCQWQSVRRPPQTLHPHPALARLNLVHSIVELNQAIRRTSAHIAEAIQVTTRGTIITGFREWHAAVSEGREVVDCFESALSDEQALESILIHDQCRRSWNSFNRVCIALELKAHFQQRAFANQSSGGKYKGLANLPKAECIDVREEIGALAGVSGRTVSNVERIL